MVAAGFVQLPEEIMPLLMVYDSQSTHENGTVQP